MFAQYRLQRNTEQCMNRLGLIYGYLQLASNIRDNLHESMLLATRAHSETFHIAFDIRQLLGCQAAYLVFLWRVSPARDANIVGKLSEAKPP
jgi:hypothetical protein